MKTFLYLDRKIWFSSNLIYLIDPSPWIIDDIAINAMIESIICKIDYRA